MLLRILAMCVLAAVAVIDGYEIPEPKFKLLKPRGFRVSIPDESGLQLFAFHGNLNKDMEHLSGGQMSGDIVTKENGRWVYENKKLKLRKGDVINYWVFVIKNGIGYRLDGGVFKCGDVKFMGKRSQYLQRRKRHVGDYMNGYHYTYHIPQGPVYHQPGYFPHHHSDEYWPYPGGPDFPYNHHYHHSHHNHHHHNCHGSPDYQDYGSRSNSGEESNEYEPIATTWRTTQTTTTTQASTTKEAPATTETPTTIAIATSPVPSIDIRFKED